MTLYSKESVTAPCRAMSRSDRFVHSYILTGDAGVGKKTSAMYLAMLLLCDEKNACGVCRQCRRVLSGQHPDLKTVEKSTDTKVPIYKVDDVRKMVSDSYVPPNDCDRKVYILADCDGWKDAAQNALLKITEDPPDHAYFIFTARGRSVFLPTLISRSMVMEVHEADQEGCIAAMREYSADFKGAKKKKFSDENIETAARLFSGNIGCAIAYSEGDGKLSKAAAAAADAAKAAAEGDEYTLAAVLDSISGDRDQLRTALEMLARIIRDSAVIRKGGGKLIGCVPDCSRRIAERVPSERIMEMYDAICEASLKCTANCSASAAAAVLAGKLI